MIRITSPKNELIKGILTLQTKPRERRQRHLTTVEGLKEVSIAVQSGVDVRQLFICPEIGNTSAIEELLSANGCKPDIYHVSREVFAKISYRETTGGIVAVVEPKLLTLNDLQTHAQSLFIILEAVEKPGNLGAVCRIADAAQVDGIIVCDAQTDIYNPNVVRASLGCVFSNKIVTDTSANVMAWLRQTGITSYAAELTNANCYYRQRFSGRTALVFGTEATGLTSKWIQHADHRIKIPMNGLIDSLNVSIAVAVVLFEVKRQLTPNIGT